jgi:hypothetical protein
VIKVSTIHAIKCAVPFFNALKSGNKTFEFRKMDRDYKVGDLLHILEVVPGDTPNSVALTGRSCSRAITYILTHADFDAIPEGWGILSVKEVL